MEMFESTPRRLLCLLGPFSQQSSRVGATLDNARGDLVTRLSTSLNQLGSVFSPALLLPPPPKIYAVYLDGLSTASSPASQSSDPGRLSA